LNYAGKFDATFSTEGSGLHPQGQARVETITKHATHTPADAIIVPDAQLLFNGDFKRAGVDLVLSHDHQELVLHDYFKGEKRAALSSPDGAHLTGDIVSALTGHTEYAQADGSASAGKVIGHVTKLTGTATIVRNGVSIILNNGDNVEKGDVVQSGSDSTLGITFIDGTVFGLSSNARMVLNEMVYDPNGSNNSSLISLVAGTISFVAGETAKHGDMKVDTPVATMGIRGTAVLVEIDFQISGSPTLPPDPNAPPGLIQLPNASFQVLVEPDGTTGSYILFDKNTLTPIATVNQAGQQINISQGQVSITNAPLPPDIQKLITDVFSLKFTDSNPKSFDHFTDFGIPQSLQPIFLQNGTSATPIVIPVNVTDNTTPQSLTTPGDPHSHIPGPPTAVIRDAGLHLTTAFALTELAGKTHASDPDSVSVRVNWVDPNPGDVPTAQVKFGSFAYHNAAHADVTAALSAQQLADIAAIELNLVPVPGAGNNNNGFATITYSMPDNAFDFLAAGESVTLTYLVDVHNNFAANDEVNHLSFTITIDGTNDAPTVAATSAAVAEHSGATDHAGGTITFTDVDLTDRSVVTTAFSTFTYKDAHGNDIALTPALQAEIAAVEAGLTLNPSLTNANNGSVTWSYNVADGLLSFLADGDLLTLTYTASVDDGHGGLVNTPITVTILGVSDVPFPISERSNESQPNPTGSSLPDTASGTLAFTGVDLNAIESVGHSLISVTWSGGGVLPSGLVSTLDASLTESVTSSVGFNFSAADKTFDFLAVGETLAVIYDVTVTDNHGVTTTRPVTIIVTGTNDTPAITSETQAGAIAELSNPSQPNPTGSATFDTATGAVTFTDVDLNDHHTVSVTDVVASGVTSGLPGNSNVLGWLSLGELTDSTGTGTGGSDTWTFSAQDGNFDYLADGETVTLTYTVQVDDGHGGVATQPVTITITGTNDTPVITSGMQAGAVTELFNESQPNPTGSTALDTANGTVTFTDVDLSDHHTVTVTGVVPSGVTSGLPDNGDVLNWLSLGKLNDTTGTGHGGSDAWTFSAQDQSFDYLADGETLTLTYTVQVDDGHGGVATQPVTITITGTNDTPVITSETQAGAVTELFNESQPNPTGSSALDTTTGTVTFTDVDLSDVHTVTITGVVPSGVTSGLPDGATLLTWFSLGDLNDTTGTGLGGSDTWTFSAQDQSFDYLAAGETVTLTYTVQVDDGHGGVVTQPVTITVTGTNDTPVITSGTQTGTITERTNASQPNPTGSTALDTATGTVTFTDVDLSDHHTVTITGVVASGITTGLPDNMTQKGWLSLGTLTDTTGSGLGGSDDWKFSAQDKSFDYLAAGEILTLTYTVQVDDGHGGVATQPVTITVTGTNDTPVITSGTQTGTIAERSNASQPNPTGSTALDTANGTVTFTDVDLSDHHTVSITGVVASGITTGLPDNTTLKNWLSLGTLTDTTGTGLGGSDAWNFSAQDKSFDYLAVGETLTLTYTVQVDDGHGGVAIQPVTITVTGTNDTPVITSGTQTGTIAERSNASQPNPTGSTANDTATGAVTFTDVDLSDHHTVTVTGVVASGITTGLPDNTTLKNWLSLGTLTDTTGSGTGGSDAWKFSAQDKSFDYLAAGEILTLTYTVQVDDGHGGVVTQPVTITVTGTNDSPTITAGSTTATGAITELAATTGSSTSDGASGSIAFADPDLSDHHSAIAAAPSFAWSGGTLSTGKINALTAASTLLLTETDSTGAGSGSVAWNYSAADKTFDFLAAGQTLTVTYALTISDGHGGSVVQNVVETITGTNDAPSIAAGSTTATGAFTHDDHLPDRANGSIGFADVDLSDHHSVHVSGPTLAVLSGSLSSSQKSLLTGGSTISLTETDSTGSGIGSVAWNYSLTDRGADVLAPGQKVTVSYTVTVDDGHGGTTSQDVVVTVTGGFEFESDPAGVAGSEINLGLTQIDGVSNMAVAVEGAPLNWTMAGAIHNADGSWTAQPSDFSALMITPDVNFVGATLLHVTETWTNPDGSAGSAVVSDNVEAYAPGSPIFAVAGDDHLTGTGNGNLFVFGQPIGHDIIYNFNAASDKIDLIGFDNIGGFADIAGNIADDANGNAVITLGDGETITIFGVHAASITANDFVFNQTPVTQNPGTMQIGDGAHLALSGTIDNTGTIELNSTGDETDLLIIQQGITLTGGGHVALSDSAENVIHGTGAGVTLTNVDNTISGGGNLGGGQLTLVNDFHGIIEATEASNPLTIDVTSFVNHGLVLSNGAGGLEVKGGIDSDGVLEAAAGLLKVDGAFIGGGSAVIDGGKMEFVAASDAVVHFSGNSSDTLLLDDVSHFTGTVTGFSYGDTIDLAGMDPANVTIGNSGSLEVHYGPGANDYFSLDGNYDAAGFSVVTDHNGGTDIVWNHAAPVIDTDQVSVIENSDGTTTIAGLQLSDADPAASAGTFAVTATSGTSESIHMGNINTALETVTAPSAGNIAVTVTDSFGATETVNFVFNETGTGPSAALQGTAGKDVLFATGHSDTLTGGAGQDQFVFAPTAGSADVQHTITDFTAGLDKIDLRQFGNITALTDLTEVQQGSDTLITLDGHDSLLLKNVAAANLSANDFILHPGSHA
jgi:VCBS repeat-containing protein